jgi:hypothetical protein
VYGTAFAPRSHFRPSSLPSTLSSAPAEADATRELQRRVNDLRQIDKVTNWWYIVREYVLFIRHYRE